VPVDQDGLGDSVDVFAFEDEIGLFGDGGVGVLGGGDEVELLLHLLLVDFLALEVALVLLVLGYELVVFLFQILLSEDPVQVLDDPLLFLPHEVGLHSV